LGLATVFFTAFYLFQGIMELFKPPGRVDWYEGFRPGQMRSRLFSASLLLGLIPMTAGLAIFLILIWSGFLEFIVPALPGTTAEQAIIPSAGWTPTSMLIGLGVAIAGWAMALFFHAFPGHPSGRWAERKKTLYVFFLNRGYFDEVYEAMIIRPFLRSASWLLRVIDLGSINRTYMASARVTATVSRWLWQVIDLGTIDRVYMTSARATTTMSRWLWQGVDVFLIDRPANGLATASFKMATKLSRVVGGKKTAEPGLPLIMLVLLVALLVLLAVVEVLLSVIVH
jgi:NADH-quinone oxidoreductase subunit L